ncbi:MAG: hypothetical protein IKW58_01935 [Alphaproteobacteria bacterium]|nr:hypothetical protein [Alphaproteobacteria bacterium]
MIWSEKELASLGEMSVNMVAERFMKRLGEPENHEIFERDNFSYLWGMLGVAGIRGVSHNLLGKIWNTLKENGVLEAFDKGVLGDFNLKLMKKCPDSRLRAWQNFDNFTTDQKFKKMVLMPVVAIDRRFAQEVDMQAFNPMRVVGVLERYPMSDAVKMMLKDMQGHGVACGISGKEVVEHYEKEKVLKRLCDIIALGKRKLQEDEKDFLFRFISEAVEDGFGVENIGIRDEVFVGLLADDEDMEGKSPIEVSRLKERNAEIIDFAKRFDDKLGFFEQSAAKLIRYNTAHTSEMIERCLKLMNGDNPKGVVFVLELVNLKQYKSAVKILIELAKKGRATEGGLFIHRLIGNVKGAENMLMSIFKLNLKVLKDKGYNDINSVFRENVARIYVAVVKEFIRVGAFRDAVILLNDLVVFSWLKGIEDIEEEVVLLANWLCGKNRGFEQVLDAWARELGVEVFVYDGKRRIGNANAVSKRAEERFIFSGNDGYNVNIERILSKKYEEDKKRKVEVSAISTKDLEVKNEVSTSAMGEDVYKEEIKVNENDRVAHSEQLIVFVEDGVNTDNNSSGLVVEEVVNTLSSDSVEENAKTLDVMNIEGQDFDAEKNLEGGDKVIETITSITEEAIISTKEVGDLVEKSVVKQNNVEAELENQVSISEMSGINNVENTSSFEVKSLENNDDGLMDVIGSVELMADDPLEAAIRQDEQNIINNEIAPNNVVDSEVRVQSAESKEVVLEPKEEGGIVDEGKKIEFENVKTDIEEWGEDEEKTESVSRIKIPKFLKINSKEMETQFNKIKEVTVLAVKKAEEKVEVIKQKVEDGDIEELSREASNRVRSIRDKFKGIIKK